MLFVKLVDFVIGGFTTEHLYKRAIFKMWFKKQLIYRFFERLWSNIFIFIFFEQSKFLISFSISFGITSKK